MDDSIASVDRVANTQRIPYVAFLPALPQNIQPDDLAPARFERRTESAADHPLGAGDQAAAGEAWRRSNARLRDHRLDWPGFRAR